MRNIGPMYAPAGKGGGARQPSSRNPVPPPKPTAVQIVRGSVSDIPSGLLNQDRTEYNWGDLNVGDHIIVPASQAVSARASAYSHARKTGKKFASQQTRDKTFIEIWRLPDPPVAEDNSEATEETETEQENA